MLKVVQAEPWEFDLVIPVPLSREKLAQRGFNQAERLAKPLAGTLGKPLIAAGLMRIREYVSQVGLSGQSRRENVRGAFEADPAKVKGSRILLVDDVFTTGATIESAAEALICAGAQTVYAVTVGKSEYLDNLFSFQI